MTILTIILFAEKSQTESNPTFINCLHWARIRWFDHIGYTFEKGNAIAVAGLVQENVGFSMLFNRLMPENTLTVLVWKSPKGTSSCHFYTGPLLSLSLSMRAALSWKHKEEKQRVETTVNFNLTITILILSHVTTV